MLTAAVFDPKLESTQVHTIEKMGKLGYIHTMEYYTATTMNK